MVAIRDESGRSCTGAERDANVANADSGHHGQKEKLQRESAER
jgi:hypothetical protein